MSYEWDNGESNPIHEAEREESRDARRHAEMTGVASCYRHHFVSDGRGGGVCRDCGDTISAGEL